MKTKTKIKIGSLLMVGLTIFVVVLAFSAQNAFANNQCNESALKTELEEGDWTPWEEDCIRDTYKYTSNVKDLSRLSTSSKSVWHVQGGFSTISCETNSSIASTFDYDIKGFFGNCSDCLYREPNVQFFYNTNEKKLMILGFGWDKHKWDTYNYSSGTTILEDELKFKDGTKFTISKECTSIEIGTKITSFGKRSVQHFYKCKNLDIVNQSYDTSKLINDKDVFRSHCFRDMGLGADMVRMPFLYACPNAKERLKNRGDWLNWGDAVFDGYIYRHPAGDTYGWWTLEDWEEKAVKDFKNSLTINHFEEPDAKWEYIYHVVDGKNQIKIDVDGHDKFIDYDIRGFFGNYQHHQHRRANVMFFYNTDTMELNLVGFGPGAPDTVVGWDYKYATMDYPAIELSTTTFQDEYDFYSGFKYNISSKCKNIYIDPKIRKILGHGLKSLKKLECVDIMDQAYEASAFNDIDRAESLAYCGTESPNGKVAVPFLKSSKISSSDLKSLLQGSLTQWYKETKVVFDGHTYYEGKQID